MSRETISGGFTNLCSKEQGDDSHIEEQWPCESAPEMATHEEEGL